MTVGALVPSLPRRSQADGGALRLWTVPWRVVSGPTCPSAGPVLCWKHEEMAKALTPGLRLRQEELGGQPRHSAHSCSLGEGPHLGFGGTIGCAQEASRLGNSRVS